MTDSGKVVGIKSKTANPEVIAYLEELLEEAKNGTLDCLLAVVTAGGISEKFTSGSVSTVEIQSLRELELGLSLERMALLSEQEEED